MRPIVRKYSKFLRCGYPERNTPGSALAKLSGGIRRSDAALGGMSSSNSSSSKSLSESHDDASVSPETVAAVRGSLCACSVVLIADADKVVSSEL